MMIKSAILLKAGILLFMVLWLLFNMVIFPNYETDYQNKPLKVLDLRLSYSEDDVAELFNKQGEEGRKGYYYFISIIDMIYPFVYGESL